MIDCQYFLDEKNESFEFSENVNKAAVCSEGTRFKDLFKFLDRIMFYVFQIIFK